MLRLAIFTALLLSSSLPAIVVSAQTGPVPSKQESDDSDLFALPSTPSLKDAIANVPKEADEAEKNRKEAEKEADAAVKEADAAVKEADAAVKEADAAKVAVESLRKLANREKRKD